MTPPKLLVLKTLHSAHHRRRTGARRGRKPVSFFPSLSSELVEYLQAPWDFFFHIGTFHLALCFFHLCPRCFLSSMFTDLLFLSYRKCRNKNFCCLSEEAYAWDPSWFESLTTLYEYIRLLHQCILKFKFLFSFFLIV